MNILADENVERAIVEWLRSIGHDVLWAAETAAGYPDDHLFARAQQDKRILLTSDRDFGEIVFRQRLVPEGVILMRFHVDTEDAKLHSLQRHWAEIEPRARGSFTTVVDWQVRVRSAPEGSKE